MKILQLVRAMDTGGLERVVQALGRGLRRGGHEVYLACLSHGGALAEEDPLDGLWIGCVRSVFKWLDPVCLLSLCSYIRTHQVEIIHSHNPQALFYGAMASGLTRVPLVHTVHGRGNRMDPASKRKTLLRRWFSRRAGRVVAVSEDVRRKLITVDKLDAKRLIVVANGVDLERRGSKTGAPPVGDKERKKLEKSRFVVGSVGRFNPEKNYTLLMRAFRLFFSRNPEAFSESEPILLLIGDGPEKQALRYLAQQLDLEDRMIMPGMQKDVHSWLEAMDVFCLSSSTEGMPMTLLEAGATSLPSVVTDVGGNAEVVQDGVTGFVVPPGDEQALAEAIEKLFADESKRMEMGSRARERVGSRYSLENMTEAYLRVYREVLSGNGEKQKAEMGKAEI